MATPMAAFMRDTEGKLGKLGSKYAILEASTSEALKPVGWAAQVSELAFHDKGLSIPEWQDIGCAVKFVADGNISVVSIGASMARAYGYSTLHYEIVDREGKAVVPRSAARLASTNYSAVSQSQTAVGRLFAHMLTPGVYTARLLVRTQHANSIDWDATLNIFSASIAVRNY